MLKDKKVVCVVPVYNEGDIIVDTIEGLKKIKYIDEILVVNDGSNDNTLDIIKTLNVSIIDLKKNHGKGYAMKKAIDTLDFHYIAFVDGDLGHTSIEVASLILPIISGEADVSIARFPEINRMTYTKGGFGILKKFSKRRILFH